MITESDYVYKAVIDVSVGEVTESYHVALGEVCDYLDEVETEVDLGLRVPPYAEVWKQRKGSDVWEETTLEDMEDLSGRRSPEADI